MQNEKLICRAVDMLPERVASLPEFLWLSLHLCPNPYPAVLELGPLMPPDFMIIEDHSLLIFVTLVASMYPECSVMFVA